VMCGRTATVRAASPSVLCNVPAMDGRGASEATATHTVVPSATAAERKRQRPSNGGKPAEC
jgi:hypothetical protein